MEDTMQIFTEMDTFFASRASSEIHFNMIVK
jgi:hypothetical protein